jgi:hypothetical protein
MKKIIILDENSAAITENNGVTIVQKFVNDNVIVLNKDDIKKILSEWE